MPLLDQNKSKTEGKEGKGGGGRSSAKFCRASFLPSIGSMTCCGAAVMCALSQFTRGLMTTRGKRFQSLDTSKILNIYHTTTSLPKRRRDGITVCPDSLCILNGLRYQCYTFKNSKFNLFM